MEFWGVKVKGGKSLRVDPGMHRIIHLSHACLVPGDGDDDDDQMCLSATVGGEEIILGFVSRNNPQIRFDLYFEKPFELSHPTVNCVVQFYGWKSPDLDGRLVSSSSPSAPPQAARKKNKKRVV